MPYVQKQLRQSRNKKTCTKMHFDTTLITVSSKIFKKRFNKKFWSLQAVKKNASLPSRSLLGGRHRKSCSLGTSVMSHVKMWQRGASTTPTTTSQKSSFLMGSGRRSKAIHSDAEDTWVEFSLNFLRVFREFFENFLWTICEIDG